MREPLPFRLASIETVADEEYRQVLDTGFTPVVVHCTACGAAHTTSIRYHDRHELVAMANRLSRWNCAARGHGSKH